MRAGLRGLQLPLIAAALIQTAPGDSARTIPDLARIARDCCVRVSSAGDSASGVLVGRDGHILTVAHGIAPQATTVRVVRNNVQVTGDVLLRDAQADVALLKISPDDIPRLRAIAVSMTDSQPKQGDFVLAAGFPARQKQLPHAIIRSGRLMATQPVLRSTCRLTAGDSGGPILNGAGHLVGINQRIGMIRDQNLHLPAAHCIRAVKARFTLRTVRTAQQQSVPTVTPAARQTLNEYSAAIIDDEGRQLGSATRLGARLFVTKLSLVPSGDKLRLRWKSRLLTVSHQKHVRASDLLFLETDVETDAALKTSLPAFGRVVWGVSGVPGIISRAETQEPRQRPSLGCTVDELEGGVTVTRISADSWAFRCGLKPGDKLQSVAGAEVRTLDDLGDILQDFNPGDRLPVTWMRGSQKKVSASDLDQSSDQLLDRQEHLDGRAGLLSLRRTGFQRVFQHDVPSGLNGMGGPVVDSNGRLTGINIAVRSRESVLAIPVDEVLKNYSQR